MPLLSTSPSRSPHYHWITGNLPPLSPELNVTDEELPDPSSPWDTLFDPLSSQNFFWHRDTLQRDDGNLDSVPLHGVVSYGKYLRLCMRLLLKVWRERWDEGSGRVYYWNVRTGETCWEQPGEFWGLGLTLDPLWTLYPLLPEGVVGLEDHHQRNHLHFHRTHHNHHLHHHHHHLLPHPPHTYTHCVHRVTGEVVEFEGGGIKEEGAATKLPLWVDAWRKGASQWTHDPFFAHGEWLNRDTGERCTNTPDEVLQAKERGGGGGGSKLQQALGQQHQYHQQPVMVSPKSGADGIKQGHKLLLLHQQKQQQQQQQQHGSPSTPSSTTITSELPPPAMPPDAPLLSPYEVELYRGLLEEEVAREDRVCDMGTIYLQDGAANGLGRGALGAGGGGGGGGNNNYGEGSTEPYSSGTVATTLHTQHTITVKLDPQVTSNWEKDWDYHAPPTLPSLLSNPASSSLTGGVVGEGGVGGGSPRKPITGRGGHGSSSSGGGGGGGGTPSNTPLRLRHHQQQQQMGLPRTPSARALQGLPPTPSRTHYPDLHGYLYKRGGGTSLLSAMSLSGGVGWKRRFFVSHGGILTYYTSEEHFTAGEPPLKRHGLDLFHYRVMDQSEGGGGGGGGMVGEFALVPRLASYAVLSLASGMGRAVGAKSGVGGVEAAGASSSDGGVGGRGGGSGGDDAHHHHHHHHYTLQGANPDRAFYLRVGEEEGGEMEVAALAEAWKVGLRGVVEEGGSGGGGGGGSGGTTFLSPYYLQSITGEVRGDRAWMAGPSSITANTANTSTLPSVTAAAAAAAATATAATNNIGSRAGVGSGFDAGGVRVDSRTLMAIGGLSLKWVAGREALEGLMGGNDGGAAFTNTYAPFREKHPPQIKLNPVRDLQEEQHQEKQQRFKAAAAAAAATGVVGTGEMGTGMGASRRESMSSASSVAVSASGGRSPATAATAAAAAAAAVVYSPGSIPPPPPSPPPPFSAAADAATAAASPSSITITQPVAMIRMSPPPPPPGPPPPHAHPDYYFHSNDSVDGRRQQDRREEEEEEEEQQEREQEEEGDYVGIRDDLSYPLDDVPSRVSFSGDGGGDMDGSSSVVRRREPVVAAPVAANGDTAVVATGGSGGGGGGGVMSEHSSPPPPRKPYLSPLSAQQAATKRNSRFSWGAGGGLPTGTATLSAAGVTTTYSLSGAYTGGGESRYEGELGVGESVFVKTSGGQVKFSAEVSPTTKDTAGVRRNRHYLI